MRTTEVALRPAYQRIQKLTSAGLLSPEPITTYPGEILTLLRSAFDLAGQHGLTLTHAAEELAWSVRTVRSRRGYSNGRPILTLIADQ